MLYEAGWREQQTLTIEAYGRGEPGSWLLLEREPSSASSIISFKNGKYLVGDAWLRASELVHYSSADLDAARLAAVTAKRAAEGDAVNEELAVGDHTIGSVVYVKGNAAAGEAWFEAEVIHRTPRAMCALHLVARQQPPRTYAHITELRCCPHFCAPRCSQTRRFKLSTLETSWAGLRRSCCPPLSSHLSHSLRSGATSQPHHRSSRGAAERLDAGL